MAPPVYQAKGTRIDSSSTATPAWPAHLANDIALLIVESANEAVTLSTPNGFVEVANSPQGTGTAAGTAATRLTVFWCRATSSSMASPVVADAGNHVEAQILTFRGCKTSGDPWNVTAGGVAASATTSVSIPGATTSVADCLVVAIATTATDASPAAISGWTNASLASITEREDIGGTAGNGGGYGVATGVMTSAGTYNATTATFGTATVQGRMSIALEPATTAHTLVAESGSYAASGTAAALLLGHVIAAASGAYSLSGTDAGTFKGSAVIAEAGSYAITGSEANLVYTPGSNHLIVADPGSYAVTGTAAGVLLGREVVADSGSYAVTGTDASLLDARKIPADAGSYSLSGTDASLERGFVVAAAGGSYVLTGQDAQLVYEPANAYIIAAAAGGYSLTGTDAAVLKGPKVAADPGTYIVTGSSVDFLKAIPAQPIPVHRSTGQLPSPHRSTGQVQAKAGESIMDTYRTSSTRWRTSNDHLRTSDAPMRYT